MSIKTNKKLKLSDDSISQIVRLLQMAFLTGTDITDNLRTLELVSDKNLLEVDPEYLSAFEESIKKLQDEADTKAAEKNNKPGFVRSIN